MLGLDKQSVENLLMADALFQSKRADLKGNLLALVGAFSRAAFPDPNCKAPGTAAPPGSVLVLVSVDNRARVAQFYSMSCSPGASNLPEQSQSQVEVQFGFPCALSLGHQSEVFAVQSCAKAAYAWLLSQLSNLVLVQRTGLAALKQKIVHEAQTELQLETLFLIEGATGICSYILDKHNWLHVVFEGASSN